MGNTRNIYISSCATWFPPKYMLASDAVKRKLYKKKDLDKTQYHSVSVADDIYPAEMAYLASSAALKRAKVQGSDLDITIYNAIHRHGNPQLWCPASGLQEKLKAVNSLPLTINQGCNSQLLSIDACMRMMRGDNKNQLALITAADKFSNSHFDRWDSDYSLVYGDVSASVILSNKEGIARIVDLKTISDPGLEQLHRFEEAHNEGGGAYYKHLYDVKAAKNNFMAKYGKDTILVRTQEALKKLISCTFYSGKTSFDNIKHYIFPNLGHNILTNIYYPCFPDADKKSLWDFGRTVGHLGASDCIAGLSYLIDNKKVKSKDRLLCIGAGSGFTWTFMLLEIM